MAKTVLVTGCSSGIGRATARRFASEGWNVVATMRDMTRAGGLAELDNMLCARLDVQDRASIDAAVGDGIDRFGAIDAVVNNAGFGLFGTFEGTGKALIAEQFDVNFFGALEVIRAVLPHFRERRSGCIVNVSSAGGAIATPLLSLYCASKFALEGFSEGLGYELAPLGILVKIAEIGFVPDTGFNARSAGLLERSDPHPDYAGYVAGAGALYAGLQQQATADSEAVAKGIVACASDSSPRLRYVLTDDIVPLLAARRESSEDAYMTMMRALCSW